MTNEELDKARIDEACRIISDDKTKWLLGEVARLAREGWTPPEPVDPDLAEARKIYHDTLPTDPMGMTLAGIKRGRALAAAETKPKGPQTAAFQAGSAGYRDWHDITHHAIINQPAEDAA